MALFTAILYLSLSKSEQKGKV